MSNVQLASHCDGHEPNILAREVGTIDEACEITTGRYFLVIGFIGYRGQFDEVTLRSFLYSSTVLLTVLKEID